MARVVVCKECGKEFTTNHPRKQFCNSDHYRVCEVCGKSYYVPKTKLSTPTKVCSEECRRKAISNFSYTCTCKICGKKFKSKSSKATICDGKHYKLCCICGKTVEVPKYTLYGDQEITCSTECQTEKYKRTCLERYGYASPNSCKEIQDKYKETMLSRYGVIAPVSVPEFREKAKRTNLERYGVDHPTKSEVIKEKQKATFRDHYGVDWGLQSPEVVAKSKATCLEKYGVDNFAKTSQHVSTKICDPSKSEDATQFRMNPSEFIHENFGDVKPSLYQLAQLTGMRESSVGDILIRTNNRHLVSYDYSSIEEEMYEFLSNYLDTSEIIRNTFEVITPYELDIYIPKYNFAIELNPTYTHNSSLGIYGNDPIDKNYHKMKTDMCADRGIFLFHVYGYDWDGKKDIIKSMILNYLGKSQFKVFGRKCKIQEVNYREYVSFLNDNHRQGSATAKIRLGLYLDSELVSAMSFSKSRHTIGNLDNNTYELVRFCSKLNTNVLGGASKLFKHFIAKYNPERVVSFSDRSHTKGGLYSILGFKEIRKSEPNYVWVNFKTNVAYHRINAQKSNIKQFLKDDNINLSDTEFKIMEEHGYVSVFDSGTITWEWTR